MGSVPRAATLGSPSPAGMSGGSLSPWTTARFPVALTTLILGMCPSLESLLCQTQVNGRGGSLSQGPHWAWGAWRLTCKMLRPLTLSDSSRPRPGPESLVSILPGWGSARGPPGARPEDPGLLGAEREQQSGPAGRPLRFPPPEASPGGRGAPGAFPS